MPTAQQISDHMDLIEPYQPQGGMTVLNVAVSYPQKGHVRDKILGFGHCDYSRERRDVDSCCLQYSAANTMNQRQFNLPGAALHAGHSQLGVLSYKLFSGKEGSAILLCIAIILHPFLLCTNSKNMEQAWRAWPEVSELCLAATTNAEGLKHMKSYRHMFPGAPTRLSPGVLSPKQLVEE